QFNLGVAYTEGRAARRDYEEALRWYKMSAEQGYAPAQLVLGNMYSKAQGVERDAAEATKWYRQAAEQGNLTAIFLVGSSYLSGEEDEQDLVQAYMWFAVAAALGPQGAQETANRNKELVAQQMTPEQIAEAEELAKNWEPVRSIAGGQ
ncbi:MAG: tetratricopeptide repeat protein, partial [Acidobacteria bacterium]|nr:tetratricopeptide repeat protein [Acidobacteriota bacterium]